MKCKFCGKNIKKNSEICTCCGRSINEELGTDDLIDAMPEIRDEFDKISKLQAQDKKKKEKKKKRAEHKTRRIVTAIIVVVAILSAVLVGMLYWKKNSKVKKDEEEVTNTSAIESAVEKMFLANGFTDDLITDADSAKNAINSVKGTFSFKDADNP